MVINSLITIFADVDDFTKRGWIELKYSKSFPKKALTPVRLHHFTAQQKNFLRKHNEIAGACFVLWQVADWYFLFNGNFDRLGELTKEQMVNSAVYCADTLEVDKLIKCLI